MPQPIYDIPMTAPYAFQTQHQQGAGGQAGAGLIGLAGLAIQASHDKAMQGREFKHDTEMNKMLHQYAIENAKLQKDLQEQLAGSNFGREQAAKAGTTPELWAATVAPKAAELAMQKAQLEMAKISNETNAQNPQLNPLLTDAQNQGAIATARAPKTAEIKTLAQNVTPGQIATQSNFDGGQDTLRGPLPYSKGIESSVDMMGRPVTKTTDQGYTNPGGMEQPPVSPDEIPSPEKFDNAPATPAPTTSWSSILNNPQSGGASPFAGVSPTNLMPGNDMSSVMPSVSPASDPQQNTLLSTLLEAIMRGRQDSSTNSIPQPQLMPGRFGGY